MRGGLWASFLFDNSGLVWPVHLKQEVLGEDVHSFGVLALLPLVGVWQLFKIPLVKFVELLQVAWVVAHHSLLIFAVLLKEPAVALQRCKIGLIFQVFVELSNLVYIGRLFVGWACKPFFWVIPLHDYLGPWHLFERTLITCRTRHQPFYMLLVWSLLHPLSWILIKLNLLPMLLVCLFGWQHWRLRWRYGRGRWFENSG